MKVTHCSDFKLSVCLGCSLCCDDVLINATADGIEFAGGICELGQQWYRQQSKENGCQATGGQSKSWINSALAAASLLRAARNPLILGLDHLSLEEVQYLALFAQRVRGTIDLGLTPTASGKSEAFFQLGQMTASLGQLATCVSHGLFIDWQPEITHPRFLARFGSAWRSLWRMEVRSDTKVSRDGLGKDRDQTIRFASQAQMLSALGKLEERLRSIDSEPSQSERQTAGLACNWNSVLEDLESATGIVVMVGAAAANDKLLAEQVTRLVRLLNDQVKAYLLFASEAQVAGSESVLTWTFGYPGAINLNTGIPKWNRDEYSARKTLERQNFDCLLVCGNDPEKLAECIRLAGENPVIALHSCPLPMPANVSISVQQCGWDGKGDWMRMDEMVLHVDPVYQGDRPSLIQVLERVEQGL